MGTLQKRLEKIERRLSVASVDNPMVVYICSARKISALDAGANLKGCETTSMPEFAMVSVTGKLFRIARAEGETIGAFRLRVESMVEA